MYISPRLDKRTGAPKEASAWMQGVEQRRELLPRVVLIYPQCETLNHSLQEDGA